MPTKKCPSFNSGLSENPLRVCHYGDEIQEKTPAKRGQSLLEDHDIFYISLSPRRGKITQNWGFKEIGWLAQQRKCACKKQINILATECWLDFFYEMERNTHINLKRTIASWYSKEEMSWCKRRIRCITKGIENVWLTRSWHEQWSSSAYEGVDGQTYDVVQMSILLAQI